MKPFSIRVDAEERLKERLKFEVLLEEVLQALKKAPHLLLYLDLKIDGDLTAGAEDYAKAISLPEKISKAIAVGRWMC